MTFDGGGSPTITAHTHSTATGDGGALRTGMTRIQIGETAISIPIEAALD